MPELILWKNEQIDRFRKDMDRMFSRLWDDFCFPFLARSPRDWPVLDLLETQDTLMLRAEIPGVFPEDLSILLTEDTLTIEVHVNDQFDQEEQAHQTKRREGYYSRSIYLPCKVMKEEAKATVKDGVLNVMMPKCEARTSPVIKITVT